MSYTLDESWELPTPEELAREIVEAEPEYPEPSSEEEITALLDEYSVIKDRAEDFNMYEGGVDFNIKLRNIDLGEKAPNYNEANDEAFGDYLMEVYFPDQMELFLDNIWEESDQMFVKEDVSQLGRSGGHLVFKIPDRVHLDPVGAIGYGNNTIVQDIREESLQSMTMVLDALDKMEQYISRSLDFFATDMSEEREFFEREYGSMEEEPKGVMEEEEYL